MSFRQLALCAFLAVALAPQSEAQAIRGRLVHEGSDAPIAGALVVLQDSAGRTVAQAASGDGGRFALRAPTPGSFTLKVLRIGYAPSESVLHLASGESAERTVVLTGMLVTLPEITVAGTPMCGARARGDSLSSALWTQAGTALSLTIATVQSHSYRFETILDDRDIDRSGAVSTSRHAPEIGISAWPVRSPSPDTLLASGFVANLEDLQEGPTWYGPDPEFLLSESFFAGHCFRTVPPLPDDPHDWVGLSFEPGFQDHRADIRGTLWLDRRTAELRRLDFEYTRLPKWARGTNAGGDMLFAPLPGGGWIVQRWSLRVPVPRVDLGTRKTFLHGYRESGGYVAAVLSMSGELVLRYPF